MNLRYLIGVFLSVPLLPLLYVQGKRIKDTIPALPEAAGPEGIVSGNPGQPLRLLFLGESTIAGVGVKTHEEGFAGALAKELARGLERTAYWKVYARSGFTAKEVRLELLPMIPEKEADLIIVGIGGNDAFELNTPGRWRIQVKKLIEDLEQRFPEAVIYFTNMPPIKSFPAFTPALKFVIGNLVEILGRELAQVAGNEGRAYYYDRVITPQDWMQRLGVKGEISDFFSDGVHPSKLTYQVWARDFADFILAHY